MALEDLVTTETCRVERYNPASQERAEAVSTTRNGVSSILVKGGILACFPAFLRKLGILGATAVYDADRIRITAPTTRAKLIKAVGRLHGVTVIEY